MATEEKSFPVTHNEENEIYCEIEASHDQVLCSENENLSATLQNMGIAKADKANGKHEKRDIKRRSQRWEVFLESFMLPELLQLREDVKSFLFHVSSNPIDGESAPVILHKFIDRCVTKMREYGFLNLSEDLLREGFEKLLLSKLYDILIRMDPRVVKRDSDFTQKLKKMQNWVLPEHLDLPTSFSINDQRLRHACHQIASMSSFRAPMDKVICVLNCCQIVANMLSISSAPSADDFLPCLIFVIIQASPEQLIVDAEFVNTFAHPKQLNGHNAYYFTHFLSALSFIENIDGPSLGMDPFCFEKLMSEEEPLSRNHGEEEQDTEQGGRPEMEVNSPSEITEKIFQYARRMPEFKNSFKGINAEDLKVSEIPMVLKEYQEMVLWLNGLKEISNIHELKPSSNIWDKLFKF